MHGKVGVMPPWTAERVGHSGLTGQGGPAVPRWLRGRVRWTIQMRLTLLYGALFVVAGALLLVIIYVLVAHHLDWMDVDPPEAPNVGGSADGLPTPQAPVIEPAVSDQLELQRSTDLRKLLIASGMGLAFMTLLSVGLGWLMARRALRPLHSMAVTAKVISEQNLHRRLAVLGPEDEIKELADTFDGLLGRLESAFEAQRRFVANASHELRTPLTLERSLLEVALADRGATADSLRDVCGRVLASSQHQEKIIEALLTLARSQRGLDRRTELDLSMVAGELLDGVREEVDDHELKIEAELNPALMVGDLPLVERLIANVVDNAVRHNSVDHGWVRIWTGTVADRPTLRVANSGPLIRPDQVDALFQPFQRLDETCTTSGREGLGVGLSIVEAIVTAHGGELRPHPLSDGGLSIEVSFHPRPHLQHS